MSFMVPAPLALTPEEGDLLIRIAVESIRARLGLPHERIEPPAGSPLFAPAGAFVTIYRGDALRGCLGLVTSRDPVWMVVKDIAASSATRDPRFESVAAEEVPELSVEISVLGPLALLPAEPAAIPELVRIGEHGLFIRCRGMSGLLLPQVPVKYGWDPAQFLEELCYKAGLPGDAWRHRGAEISAFRCAIFSSRRREEAEGPGGD